MSLNRLLFDAGILTFVPSPTLYPIIHSQIGLDVFISALSRVRSDVRFKAISSDSPVIFFDADGYEVPATSPEAKPTMWLDWPFVEFWKANSCEYLRSH